MDIIGSFEAKNHLSALLDRVSKGESITITRRGLPVAMLVPPKERPDEGVKKAIGAIHQLRKGNKLGKLTIQNLQNEGRR